MGQRWSLNNTEFRRNFDEYVNQQLLAGKEVTVEFVSNKRTPRQNNALHKYLALVAEALQAAGIDARHFFKPEVEIPVTPEMLKRDAWKPIQEAMFGIDSTKELDRKQVNQVYEVFDRHLSQSHGIHIEFPSEQSCSQ